MPKSLSLLLALAAALLAGCASQNAQIPQDDERVQARVYEAPYDDVFSAAIEAAAAMNWRVAEEDREGGLLTAQTPEATPPSDIGENAGYTPDSPNDRQEDSVDVVFVRNEDGVRVEIVSGMRFVTNVEDAKTFLDTIADFLDR